MCLLGVLSADHAAHEHCSVAEVEAVWDFAAFDGRRRLLIAELLDSVPTAAAAERQLALVADLPVITSSLNGASEIITPRKNGTVIADPRDTDAVVEAIRFWILQRGQAEMPPKYELSLERNVEETLAVLQLAARENRR